MALVVFLRGVNVGRNKRFQPAALARELPFEAVNVGAAGTLVVRKAVSPAALRSEILQRLPFEAEVMVCRASEVVALAREPVFADAATPEDAQRFVSVLARKPRAIPTLPIAAPAGKVWEVRIVGVSGPFALSFWRHLGDRVLYPNEVVEKAFGAPATTRNWNTIRKVCAVLAKKP
ncbi:MAG: DUF1697 domain-containing protein [Thermoanaerobaculia bacterium]